MIISMCRMGRASAADVVLLQLQLFLHAGILGTTGAATISSVATSPSPPLTLGSDFSVTWTYREDGNTSLTTGDLRVYEITLEPCGSGTSSGDTCECAAEGGTNGGLSTSLCSGRCVDSDGSYDVVVPYDAASGDYLVRVSLGEDPTVFNCSSSFAVQEEEDEGPGLTVAGQTAPWLEVFTGVGSPGAAFTARWMYLDGTEAEGEEESGAAGDFAVDLYACEDGACDNGSCGTFAAALCPESGCHDPGTGDYDVVVPADLVPGDFTLYVEELSENGPWDCASFVVSEDPTNTTAAPAPAPAAAATAAPTAAATAAPAPPPQNLTPAPTAPLAVPTPAPVAAAAATATASPSSITPRATPATPAPTVAAPAGEPGSPGVPPTPVPDKTVCDPTAALAFSYDARTSSEIEGSLVTIEHASGNRTELGCVTLTDMWEWLLSGPEGVPTDLLYPVDPTTGAAITSATTVADVTGTWLVRTSLAVTNGVTLNLYGSEAGGDCDELKIKSSTPLIHAVRGHGGNIDIYKTFIQGWDEDSLEPHTLPADSIGEDPRSYIACSSEVVTTTDTCDSGNAKDDMGECRMDMVDSELAYMGYEATESYGISWKVRGYCADKSNPEVFDDVQVYGDMTNCNIHHNWYGMYSYGHQAGVWTNNLMHDNHIYGFDPHDDSDYLTIRNNTVWNNGKHGIIASKRCDHIVVQDNKVDSSGGSGIMLHRSCDDSEVTGNIVTNSGDAGIALVETRRTMVSDNALSDNKWGFRLTTGASENQMFDNVLENNWQREIHLYPGSDEPEVDTGRCTNNVFDSNSITYVVDALIYLLEADGTVISNNSFSGTDGYFEFDDSTETTITGNTGDINYSDFRVGESSCFTAETPIDPTC